MNHRIGWVCVGVLFLLSATACGTSSSPSDVVEDTALEDSLTDRSVEDLWVPDGTNDKGGQDQQVPEDARDIT